MILQHFWGHYVFRALRELEGLDWEESHAHPHIRDIPHWTETGCAFSLSANADPGTGKMKRRSAPTAAD
jgi:hypothetical protein